MSSSNNEKFNLKTFFAEVKENKILKYVIVAVLLILLVLLFSFGNGENETEVSVSEDYVTSIERRLEEALSKVEGAGNVKVVVTLESGMETVIAMKTIRTETANGVEIEETPVLVNGKTVTLMEKYPKVTGVLIVLEGNNFAVISRIQEATKSLLDINLSQIEILTMK